jgi:hypothetical protein
MTTQTEQMVAGTLVGTVEPVRPRPRLPAEEAREHALKALATFLSLVTFQRTNGAGQVTQGLRIPRDRIFTHQPDDPEEAQLPSIAFIPAEGIEEYYGLGPSEPIEGTEDEWGMGTVLYRACDYVETFTIEVYCAKHAIRVALRAGIQSVFRMLEESSALRLRLPDYYNQVASFSLEGGNLSDELEGVRNRRRGQLMVQLQVREVFLANYVQLSPIVELGGPDAEHVVDGNLVASLDVDP